MRVGPSATLLSTAAGWTPQMSSWLGGVVLANSIPIVRGSVSWTTSNQVPDALRVTVPRFSVEADKTVDWLPTVATSPLARFGQILDVAVIVADVPVRLGRFIITDWNEGDGTVEVTAAGLLQTAADDRLTEPTPPRDSGTLKSEFVRLLPGYMSAQFDPALTDRACPKTMEWDEDRLAALYEIADAWPARLRMDAWGQVLVKPPLANVSTPVLSLTDGEKGTVVSAPTADTRERSYNMVVARSSADGVTAQAIASVRSGPMSPTGEYRPVPKFFASPLLLTEAQCAAAAHSMLTDAVRPSSTVRVELAPDPRVELDDPVEIIVDKGTLQQRRTWGYVTGVDMPLTVFDGAMRIDVAVF